MKEKIIAFIASVKEREEQLKIVIESIYDQVDLIHLVLNWYEEVPDWVGDLDGEAKIFCHFNPENKNAHDAIWNYLDAENAVLEVKTGWTLSERLHENYYFIIDDDILYPQNYIDKLIGCIENHERRAVITVHGANILRPIENYLDSRNVYGYSNRLENDIPVDIAGCGTVAFHSSTIKPTLQDFPFPFCRDLWFSILCAKRKVKIYSVARPSDWLTALKTPGDTVYNATRRSENLQFMKDNVLKEILAPLLYCNLENNKYCLITDYDFDKQLLEKTLSTLSGVSDCNTLVFSNKAKSYGLDILTQYVIPREVKIGRAGSKIVTQFRFIKNLPDNSKVISADADLYFLKDPFVAFKQDFDIAVTTRPDTYQYPINQGVVMLRVNNRVRDFLDFLVSQVYKRTWQALIEWQAKFNHTGNDWCIGQDMMCVAWLHKLWVLKKFGVKIVDIGSEYNFCPHSDGIHTFSGKQKLMNAYNDKSVSVLHLKSKLKELLFDGQLK